jgi:7-keto-8-aminopelargonate synthetase-like enzyme
VRTADWNVLGNLLRETVSKKGERTPVVFTDTVGSDTRPGPVWDALATLQRECILVADDSHGIGICGPDGSGSWKALSEFGFRGLLLCASLGKALGVTAGMVAGPSGILERLRDTPFFAGASPAPPAGLGAMAEALDRGRYREKFNQLVRIVDYFQQKTKGLSILSRFPRYPVFYVAEPKLASYLRANRIFITDFEYAAEAGSTSPRRIVLTAAHQARHIDPLAGALTAFS